ncbi:MAG: hypothetical protein NTW19_11035 [Planctomycetota bacterium]|nr:hypothetical protein [Planctomycetota bacterium]
MTRFRMFTLVLAAALLTGAGCAGAGHDPAFLAKLAKTTYPKDSSRGEDIDIVVTRKGNTLKLNNRTPMAYENMQFWINQQYVRETKLIKIGNDVGDNRFELSDFLNVRAEPFPTGGLLTPDKGSPVVLAELFDPATGKRHRLLVRSPK